MYEPTRYRKRPVVIEAVRIATSTEAGAGEVLDPNTRSHAAIAGWMLGHGFSGFRVVGDCAPFGIAIQTLEGEMTASPGDYVIRGIQGEFYPCKPDIFEATYEVAS